MTNASDKLWPDDFSEKHLLPIDLIGAHKQFSNLQDNIYGYIQEVNQNMFDSNDSGKPNVLEILLNPGQEPSIKFIDRGPYGITKNHNGDIDAFISELKATTQKEVQQGLRRKGIGMFQYPNIAPFVIITSMDQEMIYHIPLWRTPEGGTAYGKISKKPAMLQKYRDSFGIYEPGTMVAFHHRPKDAQKIDEKELIKITKEKWALRLFDEPKITFLINGKTITPMQYILDHPPHFIQRMNSGANIRGNIWKDEEGNGHIKVFQDGYLVETYSPEPRQCTGYVECNSLPTDAGRTKFLKDNKIWDEFKIRLTRECAKFPRISPEIQDRDNVLRVVDLATKILILPKAPTASGKITDYQKVESTGDMEGDDTVGYETHKEPDPNRVVTPRPGGIGIKHDMENQTRIGDEGEDSVMKTSDDEKGRRTKYQAINFSEDQPLGPRPLFVLYTDRKPALLAENRNNAEHQIYLMLKEHLNVGALRKMYNCKMSDWLAELNAETSGIIDEATRLKLSDLRVTAWKQSGYYPKIELKQQQANIKSDHQ